MYYGVKLVFGHSIPAAFTIRTYNDGTLVTEYEVGADEISKNTVIHTDFDDFDVMKIEFTKTAEPYSRIVLNNFSFGDITDFTMTRTDMTSSPKAIKQELVKEIIVPCYSYQTGNQQENLVSEEVTVTAGDVETFFVGEPSYGFSAALENQSGGVSILESGNYYITVKFTVTGTYRLRFPATATKSWSVMRQKRSIIEEKQSSGKILSFPIWEWRKTSQTGSVTITSPALSMSTTLAVIPKLM